MGIEIEGVWISRPSTPVPGSPILGPQKSRAPSISPSIVGESSLHSVTSTATRPFYHHPDEIQFESGSRISHSKKTSAAKALTINVEPFTSFGRESFELPFEYPVSEPDLSSTTYSSTLDMLEGKGTQWGQRCELDTTIALLISNIATASEHGRNSRTKSRSDLSIQHIDESVRDGSPSPPALTDGVSRAETPESGIRSDVRSNLTFLSESNHRLSHVAETGQLGYRNRYPKYGEMVIPAYGDPTTYRSTFNFNHSGSRITSSKTTSPSPPLLMSSSYTWSPSTSTSSPLLSPSKSMPPRSIRKRRSMSESQLQLPIVHAPKPVAAIKYPDFDIDALSSDPPNLDFDFQPTIPHIRTPSGTLLLATNSLVSPNILENTVEKSDPSKPTKPRPARMQLRRSVTPYDVTTIRAVSPTLSVSTAPSRDYRRVNENFEVSKRGSKGLYVPLDLPQLDGTAPLEKPEKEEKPPPRKLQKRRPGSVDSLNRPPHRRSRSTPILQAAVSVG